MHYQSKKILFYCKVVKHVALIITTKLSQTPAWPKLGTTHSQLVLSFIGNSHLNIRHNCFGIVPWAYVFNAGTVPLGCILNVGTFLTFNLYLLVWPCHDSNHLPSRGNLGLGWAQTHPSLWALLAQPCNFWTPSQFASFNYFVSSLCKIFWIATIKIKSNTTLGYLFSFATKHTSILAY